MGEGGEGGGGVQCCEFIYAIVVFILEQDEL